MTPARVKHWHDTIQAMLREGYKPPLSWGHHSKAVPASEDDQAYWTARYIAGKITGSEIDPKTGELVVVGEAPGLALDAAGTLVADTELPDGRKVKTAIEEVSIASRDWTDGKNRTWPDAPIHIALTPLPVWVPEGGQPPFEPAPLAAGTQRFGTSTLLYRFATEEKPPMADEPENKGKKDDDGKGGSGGYTVKDALKDLADYGIVLPDDTTDENFFERLCVALAALKGKEGEKGGGAGGEEEAPTQEESPGTFMATIGAPKRVLKALVYVAKRARHAARKGLTMSTLTTKDPVTLALAARVEAEDRARRLKRIDDLAERGLPAWQAKKLRDAATQVRFALAADGKPAVPEVDRQLDLLEGVLPPKGAAGFSGAYLATGVTEEPTPEDQQSGPAKHRRVAEEQARNSRLPTRQPAGAKK